MEHVIRNSFDDFLPSQLSCRIFYIGNLISNLPHGEDGMKEFFKNPKGGSMSGHNSNFFDLGFSDDLVDQKTIDNTVKIILKRVGIQVISRIFLD